MKVCPNCRKTYTDDELNFCLDDGSVLEHAGRGSLPETVLLNQPRMTAPQQQMPSQQYQSQQQPGSQAGWNTAPQQYSMQPKKSSKAWIWVLGILGVLVFVCGGGFAGLVYIGSQVDTNTNTDSGRNTNSTVKKGSPSPTGSKPGDTNSSTGTPDRTSVEKVDLSAWVQKSSQFGTSDFTDGEFHLTAKGKGYYIVINSPEGKGKTENANTSITVRNLDDVESKYGYGVVFHSNPTPLQQGYAFLIDAKNKRYRIVHHSPQKEDAFVAWTKSDAINPGTAENVLEVRDLPDKVDLYINGKMVNSIKNVYGYSGGVVGIYSGDGVKVAYKNLEIRK